MPPFYADFYFMVIHHDAFAEVSHTGHHTCSQVSVFLSVAFAKHVREVGSLCSWMVLLNF